MRHFVLYRYYGIIVLKSQLLRRKGIVTIRSNIKGREPQIKYKRKRATASDHALFPCHKRQFYDN